MSSALCFGDSFPVADPDSFLGRPACRAARRTSRGPGKKVYVPASPEEELEGEETFFEIVIFDLSQILPLAVVHLP